MIYTMLKLMFLSVTCLAISASMLAAEIQKYDVKDVVESSSHKLHEHKPPAAEKSEAMRKDIAETKETWKSRIFTAEELKKFDGKEGRRAYVAVDGIVYDVTGVPAWKGGAHKGMHNAGMDHSADFRDKAPKRIHHDGKVLDKLPKVGVTAEYKDSKTPMKKMNGKHHNIGAPVEKTASEYKVVPSAYGQSVSCPVTGDKFKITKDTPAVTHKNKKYYFCCPACVDDFKKNPDKYVK